MSSEPLIIHIFNALTGQTTEREMTPEEVADRETLISDALALPSPE